MVGEIMENYEDCIYFSYEIISPWHSDIFDHTDYQCYCAKSGEKKKLFTPNCLKCKEGKGRQERVGKYEEINAAEIDYEMGKMEME